MGMNDNMGEPILETAPPNKVGMTVGAGTYEIFDVDRILFTRAREVNDLSTYHIEITRFEKMKAVKKELLNSLNSFFNTMPLVSEDASHLKMMHGTDAFVYVSEGPNKLTLHAYGSEEFIEHFEKTVSRRKGSEITWYHLNRRGGYDSTTIGLDIPEVVENEYYPFLKDSIHEPTGVEDYYDQYINSSSSILLLMGPAGVGKTSFVRNMIKLREMHPAISYDPKIMLSENFLVEFITNNDHDLLVIEDADVLLSSREFEGNAEMNKFLNIGDGLIKFPRKKIIFTTNILSTSKIDEALIRPGRCFDIVHFRALTFSEANAAASKMGLDALTEERDYPISEIFNRKSHKPKKRMGF